MRPRDIRLARWLKRQGIVCPYRLVRAARKARITISTACALISMETGNGRNVYGHDVVANRAPKGGPVTKGNYHSLYLPDRRAGRGMQGVGPTQLTWWEYQDRADKLGGCWHPLHNMTVGFGILREHWQRNDIRTAFRLYNGSGAAAEQYADRAMAKRREWQQKLRRARF